MPEIELTLPFIFMFGLNSFNSGDQANSFNVNMSQYIDWNEIEATIKLIHWCTNRLARWFAHNYLIIPKLNGMLTPDSEQRWSQFFHETGWTWIVLWFADWKQILKSEAESCLSSRMKKFFSDLVTFSQEQQVPEKIRP